MSEHKKVDFDFSKCYICNVSLDDICKSFDNELTKCSSLKKHLKEIHNLEMNQYLVKNNIELPKCYCGKCNENVSVFIENKNFVYSKYYKQHISIGLREIINKKLKNTPKTDEHKKRLSESALKRIIHGHTGIKHSDATKAILRQKTLEQIKNGKMPQTNTKPHMIFADLLYLLNIEYEEEKTIYPYSFDFYLPDYNIYIEVDGDYYHSNPKIYTNGPIHKIQLKNYNRDLKKNRFCEKRNMKLIRYYEYDILNCISEVIDNIKEKLSAI